MIDERTTGPAPEGVVPRLVLGPLLRHVDATSATVWVETDRPAEVVVEALVQRASGDVVLRASTPTWGVHGHHYAIVVLRGLPPEATAPYEVSLRDAAPAGAAPAPTRVWPPQQDWPFPASAIRTPRRDGSLRLAFGSCRRSEPLDADGVRAVGPDALVAMALRLAGDESGQPWPDALLMVGDQLYADEPSPAIVERLHAAQRAAAESGPDASDVRDEICTFEEYTWLYSESWSPDPVRWLLSSVPTCMLLDDHDLRDDWNTSAAWREEVSALPWFADRVRGALGSYWVYQHLGNLSPADLEADPLLRRLQAAADDDERSALLDDFATTADADPDSARWSYVRDFGGAAPDASRGSGTDDEDGPRGGSRVRLVAVDCRCSRDLREGRRAIVDDAEWDWLRDQLVSGPGGAPVDHLLLASTLPVLMVPGFSDVEGWNEAVAAGAWGRRAAVVGEKVRRATDLEHWPAFRRSMDALLELLRDVVDGAGRAAGRTPPASLLLLAGDVHCSYTSRAQLDGGAHPGTAVHQLVMSPFRNPLKPALRLANRLVLLAPVRAVARALAASAGVARPAARWEVDSGPWFDNGVMTIAFEGRTAAVEVDHVRADRHDPAGTWQRRTTRRQLTP